MTPLWAWIWQEANSYILHLKVKTLYNLGKEAVSVLQNEQSWVWGLFRGTTSTCFCTTGQSSLALINDRSQQAPAGIFTAAPPPPLMPRWLLGREWQQGSPPITAITAQVNVPLHIAADTLPWKCHGGQYHALKWVRPVGMDSLQWMQSRVLVAFLESTPFLLCELEYLALNM